MDHDHYDLLVIGAGPAGWSAAMQGAKLGMRVAVAEKEPMLGGACVHTGTLPSKTLRHTVLQLTSARRAAHLGIHSTAMRPLRIQDLMAPKDAVIENHERTIRAFFERNKVAVLGGSASFVSSTEVRIATRLREDNISADHIVIATGSSPRRPESVPFDDRQLCDSDSILDIASIPRSITIVGGGVIGCEYASIFATLGVKVTLIDRRQQLLRFLDADLSDALTNSMRRSGIRMLLGESLAETRFEDRRSGRRVCLNLESERHVHSDIVLMAAGRVSNTASLDLDKIGIPTDNTGLIKVDERFHTTAENVYAIGDVIGFPALASTGMHQGRLAVLDAAGIEVPPARDLPIAIYTIPEISAVGLTEEQCRERGVAYEVGFARYAETPRGQIAGDTEGMLKLIFLREGHKVLGVHLIGQASSELVHVGMMLVHLEATLDQLLGAVFNYPTLSEAYRVAALDGINRL